MQTEKYGNIEHLTARDAADFHGISMNYCQTVFDRGAGLGNRLFPWARCKLYARDNRCPMLAPAWAHVRRGALLKGGIEYGAFLRKALLWRNFRDDPAEVGGLRRQWIRLTHSTVDEAHARDVGARGIVTFRGDADHFASLWGHHDFLRESLFSAAHAELQSLVAAQPPIPIAINVRRGRDFQDASAPEDYGSKGPLRTPLVWFASVLTSLRQELGSHHRAYVVSDGTAEDLKPLLALDKVSLVKSPAAISDLLILSRARILIGSGGSSFSAWAAFLGQIPTVTILGQSLAWFRVTPPDQTIVEEWREGGSGGNPAFLQLCRSRLLDKN